MRTARRAGRRKGVPSGYRHLWGYKGRWDEKKTRKGLWKFVFKATKSHRGRRSEGNFGVGTTGAWKIQGIQYIKKISPNSYQTKLIGTKKPLKFNVKPPKRRAHRRRYRK